MSEYEDAKRREHCRDVIRRFLVHHFPKSDIEEYGSGNTTFVVDGRYRLGVTTEFLGDTRADDETERFLEDLKIVEEMKDAERDVVRVEAGPDGKPTVRVTRYER